MSLSKIIGIALLVLSLMIGVMGVDKIADSTKRTNFLGIIIDTSDESGKERGYLLLGVAIVLFAGGLYAIVRPKKVI